MGQYYIVVNLDKKEYIFPDAFEGGNRFVKFSSADNGMMQALAVLTATGVGTGNVEGDLCRMAFEDEPAEFDIRHGEKLAVERLVNIDHKNKTLPNSATHRVRIFVPAVTGRWAGDRIVTAGDYTADNLYMTKAEQLRGCAAYTEILLAAANRQVPAGPPITEVIPECVNINTYANWFYTDISSCVKSQILSFNVGITSDAQLENAARNFLSLRLLAEFPRYKQPEAGTVKRPKWDLSWMDLQTWDSFMYQWSDPDDLKRAKAWIRKQYILPWQRRLMRYYHGNHTRPTDTVIFAEKVRSKNGEDGPPLDIQTCRPLLPPPQYLQAAINVANEFKKKSAATISFSDSTEHRIATQLHRPTRQRVINID